jgi:anti-anti-sigma factor
MVLSVGWLVYVSSHPNMPELGRRPGTTAFRPLTEYPDGIVSPGLLVLRFDGGLSFATAEVLEDRLRDAMTSTDRPLRALVIDFAGVNFVDSQGSAALAKIARAAAAADISLRIARAKPDVMTVLRADGVEDLIGADHFHSNIDEAVGLEPIAGT